MKFVLIVAKLCRKPSVCWFRISENITSLISCVFSHTYLGWIPRVKRDVIVKIMRFSKYTKFFVFYLDELSYETNIFPLKIQDGIMGLYVRDCNTCSEFQVSWKY